VFHVHDHVQFIRKMIYNQEPRIIGITGRPYSGKSVFCQRIENLGGHHIDVNNIIQQQYDKDADFKTALLNCFWTHKDKHPSSFNDIYPFIYESAASFDKFCLLVEKFVKPTVAAKIQEELPNCRILALECDSLFSYKLDEFVDMIAVTTTFYTPCHIKCKEEISRLKVDGPFDATKRMAFCDSLPKIRETLHECRKPYDYFNLELEAEEIQGICQKYFNFFATDTRSNRSKKNST